MNYKSARITTQNYTSLPQKSSTSRIFSHKPSMENNPVQIVQQQLKKNQPPQLKQNIGQYSFMDSLQKTKPLLTNRQGQSSYASLKILQNVDANRNSFQLQQSQKHPIKIFESQGHIKSYSHSSPLQSQNILPQSPSNQSIILRNESQENIDFLSISKERESSYSQAKGRDLGNKLEILQNQLKEQTEKSELYEKKIEILQKTVQSQDNQIELQKQQNQSLQSDIQNLQYQISQQFILSQQNAQQTESNKIDELEQVKAERDELKNTMKKIMLGVEKVVYENQQLNEQNQELNKLKQASISLQEQLNLKEKQLQQSNLQFDLVKENLNSQIKILQQEKDKQILEIDQLKNQIQFQKQKNEILTQDIVSTKRQSQQIEINMPKTLEQNKNQLLKIGFQEEKIKQLESENEKLQNQNKSIILQFNEQQIKQDNEFKQLVDDLELRILDLVTENQSLSYLLEQQTYINQN